MRNIKTSLRFVRNSALLFVAASGMSYLTACQSEQAIDPTPENPIPESPLSTASYSVYGSNPDRILNFGGGTRAAGEGAAAESFTMPAVPTVPAGAEELTMKDQWNSNDNYYGNYPAGHYVIPANTVFSTNMNQTAEGAVFYVYGTLKCNSITNSYPATIYIMDENATLDVNGCTVTSNFTIYNYGTFCSKQNDNHTLNLQCKLWSLTSIDFTEDSNCKLVQIEDTSDVRCKSTLTAKDFQIEGEATACGIVAKNHIKMDFEGTFKTSYLEANTVEMNQSIIDLDNNGLVWAKKEFEATDSIGRVKVNGNNALLYTPSLKTRDVNSKHINWNFIDQNVKVVYGTINCDLTQATVKNIYAYNQVSEGTDAFGKPMGVNAAGCHGAFGPTGKPEDPFGETDKDPIPNPDPTPDPTPDPNPNPNPDPTPDPEVELIPVADIENPDAEDELKHDHGDISATCISFGSNGTAFASFHRRGTENSDYNQGYDDNKGHKGCIEKIVYQNGAFALQSFMIAPEWDFNHILADGNRIVAVGNHVKKGAFIGTLPVDFASSVNANRDDFQFKELTTAEPIYGTSDKTGETIKTGYKNAGDGNCVVRQGNYYYVTTYEGYGPLNLDFTRVKNEAGDVVFTATTGSAKHIALNGDKMAVINLDRKGKGVTESPATINEFASSDKDFATVMNTYAAGANVAPIDGKNTIAYSGNDLFACLGHGGLVKNGQAFYQRNNAPVNGVAIVGNYIFVANGSFLDVLDLQGNRLCHYHDKNLHSSNYVAIDNNGFIYVAFGKSDIKIFKLGGTKVAADWYIAGK